MIIRLKATGKQGTRTNDVTPNDINELIEAVVDVAYGFHCDYDSVTAEIVTDDTILQYDTNLLFVGHNCDDGIAQCDDGTYYDKNLEQRFDTYDDALRENTKQDYSGDIATIYEDYCKLF